MTLMLHHQDLYFVPTPFATTLLERKYPINYFKQKGGRSSENKIWGKYVQYNWETIIFSDGNQAIQLLWVNSAL